MANGGLVGLLTLFVVTAIMSPIAILVHELGHLVAALATGMRCERFVVGPIWLIHEKDSWRVRLAAPPLPYWGYVLATPMTDSRLRLRMIVFILCGPLASIALGVFCVVLACFDDSLPMPVLFDFLRETRNVLPSVLTSMLTIAGIYNLYIGFWCLLPTQAKPGYPMDGYLLRHWLLAGSSLTPWQENVTPKSVERYNEILALSNAMHAGQRPREWDQKMLDRFAAFSDNTAWDVVADLYCYYHALDTGQLDRAGTFLDLALASLMKSPADYRSNVTVEGAFFEAFIRHDLARAKSWLDRSSSGDVEEHTRLRAVAAILLADGQNSEAIDTVQKALSAAAHSSDRGGSLAEIDWLHAIEQECERQCGESGSHRQI
jgi:peptidase M50-like protein